MKEAIIKCNYCGHISNAELPIGLSDSECENCHSWCQEEIINFRVAKKR